MSEKLTSYRHLTCDQVRVGDSYSETLMSERENVPGRVKEIASANQ